MGIPVAHSIDVWQTVLMKVAHMTYAWAVRGIPTPDNCLPPPPQQGANDYAPSVNLRTATAHSSVNKFKTRNETSHAGLRSPYSQHHAKCTTSWVVDHEGHDRRVPVT